MGVEPELASTRWGTAGARAEYTSSTRKLPTLVRPKVGAGCVQLTMVPGSARMVRGASVP